MSNDQELERYQAGDSDLSRLYRAGATEQPPPALDTAILSEGRQAAQTRPKRSALRLSWRLPSTQGWLVPVSAAAAICIAVGVLMLRPSVDPTGSLADPSPLVASDAPDTGAAPPPSPPIAAESAHATDGEIPTPGIVLDSPLLPDAKLLEARTPGKETKSKPQPPASAKEWVREIERLLHDGRQDEGRVLFYAFREQYPNHPIPEDLLTRLGM